MSLINEYLKKIEETGPPSRHFSGIPPTLKNKGRADKTPALGRWAVFAGVTVLVGILSIIFTPYFREALFPPEVEAETSSISSVRGVEIPSVESRRTSQSMPSKKSPNGVKISEPGPRRDLSPPLKLSHETSRSSKSHLEVLEGIEALPPTDSPARGLPLQASRPENTPERDTRSLPPTASSVKVPVGIPVQVQIKSVETASRAQTPHGEIGDYYQIALLAQAEGNYLKAEKFYRAVLEKDPAHINALLNLSAVYISIKKFSKAEHILARLYQIDPENAKALVNLGIIDLHQKNVKKAKQQFETALRIAPGEETALINLAFLAIKEDDIPSAETYLREILNSSPNNQEALLTYAYLLEKESRIGNAIGLYRRCLELNDIKADHKLYRRIKDRIIILRGLE